MVERLSVFDATLRDGDRTGDRTRGVDFGGGGIAGALGRLGLDYVGCDYVGGGRAPVPPTTNFSSARHPGKRQAYRLRHDPPRRV